MSASDNDIDAALFSAAGIAERYGDVYWPIYEHLDKEWRERRSKRKRLEYWLRRPAGK